VDEGSSGSAFILRVALLAGAPLINYQPKAQQLFPERPTTEFGEVGVIITRSCVRTALLSSLVDRDREVEHRADRLHDLDDHVEVCA